MKPTLVIVVDDEALIVRQVEEALHAAGVDVLTANSAEQALDLLATPRAAAALITDIQLPGMSGWDLVHHIRRSFPNMPVIYMSGDSTAHWVSEGVPNSLMVGKPFVATQLLAVLTLMLAPAELTA